MKIISIRQPWAWLILHGKFIENRTWTTTYRGPLLLHASKTMTRQDYWQCQLFVDGFDAELAHRIPPPHKLLRGGIVGRAKLVDAIHPGGKRVIPVPLPHLPDSELVHSHPVAQSPWYTGDYGLVLADARAVDFIPCPGALGLFRPPRHVRQLFGMP